MNPYQVSTAVSDELHKPLMRERVTFARCFTAPVILILLMDVTLLICHNEFRGYGGIGLFFLLVVSVPIISLIGTVTCLVHKLRYQTYIVMPVTASVLLPIANGFGMFCLFSYLHGKESFCYAAQLVDLLA